jgi:hypothetical protein
MPTSNISLGVVIGGAVGASFGQAISNSIGKLGQFKQTAQNVATEQQRVGSSLALTRLNFSKYRQLGSETRQIGSAMKASTNKVESLRKKLELSN